MWQNPRFGVAKGAERILPHRSGGLAKVAIFTTNVDTKHTLQIYEKLSYEALNRHFCQTAVLVAQLKYTKNLYKNWIFRKFKYARKEEFYTPIICFG